MREPVHWLCVAIGRVQGVNYRARVAEAARRFGIRGSVANRPDGSVRIEVQGLEEHVEAFLRDVSGPRGASDAHEVRRVSALPLSPSLGGFEILRE
jgi:acylphosphatase